MQHDHEQSPTNKDLKAAATGGAVEPCLLEIQRLELQSGVTRGVLHTINNMVMVLESLLDQLREQTDDTALTSIMDDMSEAMEEIGSSSERLQRLIKVSRSGTGPIDLCHAAGQAQPLLRDLLPKLILLHPLSVVAGQEMYIQANEALTVQLLLGLGQVARESLLQGGEVRLGLEFEPQAAGGGGLARVSLDVLATAVGPNADRPAVVTDLPGVKRALQNLRATADVLNGTIVWREDSRGGGQLILTLPAVFRSKTEEAGTAGLAILIDAKDYRRILISGALQTKGIETVPCRTTGEALLALQEKRDRPAVVIVEYADLVQAEPQEREILLTGGGQGGCIVIDQAENHDPEKSLADVKRVYRLLKPYSMDELAALTRTALEGTLREADGHEFDDQNVAGG
jgi:hypothetical protein